MNGFDLAVVAVVALSTLFAFVRGIVREMIALATWVVGFIAAIALRRTRRRHVRGLDIAPVARQAIAFGLILIVVLIAGALVARSLASVVRAIGLGFVDRILGAIFGVARGLLVVVHLCAGRGRDHPAASRIGGRIRHLASRWRTPRCR